MRAREKHDEKLLAMRKMPLGVIVRTAARGFQNDRPSAIDSGGGLLKNLSTRQPGSVGRLAIDRQAGSAMHQPWGHYPIAAGEVVAASEGSTGAGVVNRRSRIR